MKKKSSKDYILGVAVAGQSIEAVLVHDSPKGPEVIRHFTRQANPAYAGVESYSDGGATDFADESSESEDFSIQFGPSESNDVYLSGDFGLDNLKQEGTSSSSQMVTTFERELGVILGECEEAGYGNPLVAFCADASRLLSAELQMGASLLENQEQEEQPEKEKGKITLGSFKKKPKRDAMVELLETQLGVPVSDERAVFIPMTDHESGMKRFVGLALTPMGAVESTVTGLRNSKSKMPAVRLLDNEISLFLGLGRSAHYLSSSIDADSESADDAVGLEGGRKSLLVRAGKEDTLVFFFENDQLLYFENLRSITSYDAPETICSRVLLLQDEYAIGDIQHALLLSEDREDAILESFRMFFSDTKVESLREFIPRYSADHDYEESTLAVLATAAALRLVSDDLYKGSFEPVNHLPKRLLRKQVKMPVSWHVFALYGIIFISVLFWMGRYFSMDKEVREYKYKLSQYPEEYTNADPQVLQARVDSINGVTASYRRALQILDSLLVGSDKWSRTLEKTSTESAVVQGLWIDSWRPQGEMVMLMGNATARDRIVKLSRRLNGEIESITFSEIREWPVYSFTMKVPLSNELPEAAKYLRDRIKEVEAAEALDSGSP